MKHGRNTSLGNQQTCEQPPSPRLHLLTFGFKAAGKKASAKRRRCASFNCNISVCWCVAVASVTPS